VQRIVLLYDAAVLVCAINDPGEIREQVADISVGDDHLLVQRREKAPVDGLLALQALRL
jgi:hypothetical protein